MALSVTTEELKQVARDLLTNRETIMDLYNSQIKNILNQSKDAINASGLNFDDFNDVFSKVFTNVGERMEKLSNALTKDIIPKYNDLNTYISKAFNVDFANEMTTMLNKIK